MYTVVTSSTGWKKTVERGRILGFGFGCLRYVVGAVCLSVCLSICEEHYCKSNQPIWLKFADMIGTTNEKNWLTFGGDLVRDTDSMSLFHFPHHCGIADFMRFISISRTPGDFHDTRRNDWSRQDNESTTFWERSNRHSDPNQTDNYWQVSRIKSFLQNKQRWQFALVCQQTSLESYKQTKSRTQLDSSNTSLAVGEAANKQVYLGTASRFSHPSIHPCLFQT